MAAVEETLKYIRERQRVKIRNKEIKGNIKRAQTLDRGREGKNLNLRCLDNKEDAAVSMMEV